MTGPSKQCEFYNYLYDKSLISQGGSVGQSGLGGPGISDGKGGPGGPGGMVVRGV